MKGSLVRKEKGQALIEFTIILPILLLLLFGIMEFGRIYSTGLIMNHVAREGVRTGCTGASDSEIIQVIRNSSPTLDSNQLLVTITPEQSLRTRGRELTVQVSYPVRIIAPFISVITGETVTVSGYSVMRIE